jgi:hypothetical protein
MASFSLRAVFGLDATGLKTELKTLRGEVNSFAKQWASIGIAAAGAAFIGLARSAIGLGSKLSDLAVQTGTNVESLQALNAIARDAGVPLDSLSKALIKTRTAASEAAAGKKEMSDAFRALNIDVGRFMAMPQERKLEVIGRSYANASDKAAAYNAVSTIFGERVGPKMIEVLDTLSTRGFDEVAESARKAGDVMSAETILAMDKASDAIEAFKQRATIAVGNIIVNFRSEEGIALLGLQFMKVVGTFGAHLLDAFTEVAQVGGAALRGSFKYAANFLGESVTNALIDVAAKIPIFFGKSFKSFIGPEALEKLKQSFAASGEGLTDSIRRAILETSPSTFKKEVGEFWDKRIDDQKKIVEALNARDFGKDAEKLRNAGAALESGITKGAAEVQKSGVQAGAAVAVGGQDAAKSIGAAAVEAAQAIASVTAIGRIGASYQSQSTTALTGVRDRLRSQRDELALDTSFSGPFTPGAKNPFLYAISAELRAVEMELAQRREILAVAQRMGEDAARYRFGDELTDRALRDLKGGVERTSTAVEAIAAGLRATGIIPHSVPPRG